MTYDFANYKKDALTRPRDIAWSSDWGKFEKVGDKIQGIIRDAFYRPAEGQFKEQRAFTIEQADKSLINVGIKRLPFQLPQTDNLCIGDPLTIVLEQTIPSKTKGFSATKVLAFYGKHLTENVGPTVKQLEAEDMAVGGSKEPEVDTELEEVSKDFQDTDPLA